MTQEGHAKALGSKDERKSWAHGAFLSTSEYELHTKVWDDLSAQIQFFVRLIYPSHRVYLQLGNGRDPEMNSVRRQVLIGEKSIQLRIITGLDTSTLKSKHLKVGSVESTNRLSLLGDACNTIQEPQSIGLLSM